MEISRRDFLVLAASAPIVASLPAFVFMKETPVDPYRLDELPLSGSAGECSGRH